MIAYEQDQFGFKLLLKIRGSVFPGAAKFAVVPAILSVVLNIIFVQLDITYDLSKLRDGYGSFIFVLGFALVFRSSSAYGRYWEGANLLRQMRTELHDACGQIVCFCMTSAKTDEEKNAFKSCIVALFSLLHCLALQQIADMEDESFEVLDLEYLDRELLESLNKFHEPLEKAEVVCQWIQRVILEGIKKGFIPTPPPIVSRAFQEINSGVVCMSKLQVITDNPFPFPYAQMIAAMLCVHLLVTPVLIGMLPVHFSLAFVFAFISVFCLVALNIIAQEIENPFGDDANDLRCDEAQLQMNEALSLLLSDAAAMTPDFSTPKKKGKIQQSTTKRLSTFLPRVPTHKSTSSNGGADAGAGVGADAGAGANAGAGGAGPVASGRTSFVTERRRESLQLSLGAKDGKDHNSSRRSVMTTNTMEKNLSLKASPPHENKIGKEQSDSKPKEPDKEPAPVVNIHPDNAQANKSAPAASKPAEPPPQLSSSTNMTDALVAKKDITTSSDFWVHLEESFRCTENLQRQSASELKDIHLTLGQLTQMVSQGLSLAGLTMPHPGPRGPRDFGETYSPVKLFDYKL